MWGTIPDWLTVLYSLGALGAAITAASITRRLYKIETKRDEHRAEEIKKAQSSKVTAWWYGEMEQGKEGSKANGLVVRNASDSVTYDLRIESAGNPKYSKIPIMSLHVVPPGELFVEYKPNKPEKWDFAQCISESTNTIRPLTRSNGLVVRYMKFRDSNNMCWVRDEKGFLMECEQPTAGTQP